MPTLVPGRRAQADGTQILTMTLAWGASPGPMVGSYDVQWSLDAGQTWTGVSVSAAQTSYEIAPAAPKISYLARVRAVRQGGGVTSAWATAAPVTSQATDPPPPPAIQVLKSGTPVATRPGINFLPGANVTLSIRDNPQASAVDVAISATGGGGSGGPGTGVPRTPPDPAAFAWANQGAAAVTFDGVRSIITIPPENGTQVRCLLQPLSGPAWTAVLSIDPGAPFVGSYILPGLVLFNQGTGQYCIVGGVRNSSSIVPTAYYGSSLSKYSSNLSNNTSTPIFGPFWSMVKYDGKNIAISISSTGFVWSTFYTGDLSVVGGAITHVGFGISSDGHPSNPLAAVFDSFSVSYP